MNCKRLLRGLALPVLTLALAACGGGSADPVDSPGSGSGSPSTGPTGSTGSPGTTGLPGTTGSGGSGGGTPVHAGMGSSNAPPTGATYTWSRDVQVDQPIKGDDPSCVPDDQHGTPHVGHGGLVRVCLGFRNTAVVPLTVTLTPGLIFVSDDIGTQNGVVLTKIDIVVPASTTTTWYVPVYLFCLNLGRHPTLDAQDTYQTGPVTDDAAVLELLALLKDKQVPLAFDFTLQQILWDITDGTGLTQDDRNALAAL